jgi:hypothetical protein
MDWRQEHPFHCGQTVYAKAGTAIRPMTEVAVHIRGKDEFGFWIAKRESPRQRLSAADFTSVGPMPPNSEGTPHQEVA